MKNRHSIFALALAALMVLGVGTSSGAFAAPTTKEELVQSSEESLHKLIATNPTAAEISKKARAVLIFPSIVKAGLIFGGAYGEGVLRAGDRTDGYYNSFTASWGLQAGAQDYGYVVFLMNDRALSYIHQSHGWEIGVGPTVVLVNEGVAKNLSSTTMKDDAYAFIYNQEGLMAGISIEGTKITRIQNP